MKRIAKTTNERQATLRAKNKAWLKANGFNSVEGLMSALRNGLFTLIKSKENK